MSANYCTITGLGNLPIQFSYKPPTPNLRMSEMKTGDGSLAIQGNVPVAGDAIVQWVCPDCTQAEWKAILDLFTDASTIITSRTFTGYWGESFTVLCLKMEPPTVKATRFDLAGEFQVIAVSSWGTAS